MVNPRARAVGKGTLSSAVLPMGDFTRTEIEAGRELDFVEMKRRDGFLYTVRGLSPGEERMLKAVYAALELNSDPAKSYRFRAFTTRSQIAAKLGRQGGLVPHDVRVLNELVQRRLVKLGQHPRPVRTFVGVDGLKKQMGAGWEYAYGLDYWLIVALLSRSNPAAFAAPSGAVNPSPVSPVESNKTEPSAATEPTFHHALLNRLDDWDIAERYRGQNYTSDTHIYTWDHMMGKHRKRPKPKGLLRRLKEMLEDV